MSLFSRLFRSNKVLSLLVAILLILSMFSLNARVDAITMITDQECSAYAGGHLDGIGAYPPAGQTFRPTYTSLVAFAINIYVTSGAPTPMTAKILSGGIGGAVVGSVDFSIPGGFGVPSGDWYLVSFPSGVQVTPGSAYALDLTDNFASSGIKWNRCDASYTNGDGYSSGAYLPGGGDYMFREYAGDFSVSPASGSMSVVQGSSGSTGVTVSSLSNFASVVLLTLAGVPGITGLFSPMAVTPPSGGSAPSTLTVDVAGSVAPGVYPVSVNGMSGPLSHSASLSVTVIAAATPDFLIAAAPVGVSVVQGSSAGSLITVTSVSGFSSAVTLTPSWLGAAPTGVTFNIASPVTPPAGSTASSTITIAASSSASTGAFTLQVTGTSGSLTHTALMIIQVTAAATTTTSTALPDFTLSSSTGTIAIIQGSSGSATITVGSLNAFSSPVSLTPSWVGTAPAGVTFTITSPIAPPSGGLSTSPVSVNAASTATTGSFTLRVTGNSGSLTHSVDITIQVTAGAPPTTATTGSVTTAPPGPSCLIATATYGSELAPEVQLLRNFRDNSIMKTQAGSNFMVAFNAWYYSFSPAIASYLSTHSVERTIMKGILYPLIAMLFLTSSLYSVTAAFPELAVLLSGSLASSLIGAFYVGLPIGLLRAKVRRLRGLRAQTLLEKYLCVALFGGVVTILLGEVFASPIILMISSATVVLSTLFLSATVTSAKVAEKV